MIAVAREHDLATYPAEENVAETLLHLLIRTLLLDLVGRWLDVHSTRALVGSEQFVYWVRGDPRRTVAPDLYVLYGVDPLRLFPSWKVWDEGIAPRLAVEIVSDGDLDKDYVLAPIRYAEMGVEELVIFDPSGGEVEGRVRWQVYRRKGADLLLAERTDADRVLSEVLGCHLRRVDEGTRAVVRLGTGPNGEELFPTAEESERARRIALEAEVAELRRRLRNSGEA